MVVESKNSSFAKARDAKQDEFYTQLSDIEKELKHYKKYFKGKVVYCNCDDPRVSGFFHYFSYNFEKLGLKKLITTGYKNSDRDLFSNNNAEHAIMLEYTGDKDGNNVPSIDEIGVVKLKGDGDFRSEESMELLADADIVVTNPPFSLFREYINQLLRYEKKFLIVGNQNAITYVDVFPHIKENRIWLGYNNGDMSFKVPDHYESRATRFWVDTNGQKWRSLGNACWFTNLDISKRHEDLILYKQYTPEDYPNYDNYDAIEVSKTKDIPLDFSGAMGVPITFLDKYNPNQFEILGITDRDNNSGLKTKEYSSEDVPNHGDLNRRGAIKVGDQLKSTYARLLIRRK